jgi:hypothetical protein
MDWQQDDESTCGGVEVGRVEEHDQMILCSLERNVCEIERSLDGLSALVGISL